MNVPAFLSGFDAVFCGNIPRGGGLSSSAALSVAWLTALKEWTSTYLDPHEMARMAQRVERDFLGLPCGLLDPVASIFSEENCVLRVDFQDLNIRPIPANFDGLSWVILHTGVVASWPIVGTLIAFANVPKAWWPSIEDTEFDISVICGWICSITTPYGQNVFVMSSEKMTAFNKPWTFSNPAEPNNWGPSSANVIGVYEMTTKSVVPNWIGWSRLGEAHPGGLGGRMMGGGFGGCALHLVRTEHTQDFMDSVLAQYRQEFDWPSRAFCLELGAGANCD